MDAAPKDDSGMGLDDDDHQEKDDKDQIDSFTPGQSSDDLHGVIVDDVPEGGWGWMVLIASLLNTFILDGIGGGFGLLYPYIMDKFKATASVTSFAGSLFVSYMMMGSLAAWLVDRLGYRVVGMTGGVLCCLSFVAAAFCDNIYVFILTFGLFAGCSTGLVYLPSVVVVNSYFNKKRGLANGIVSSGAGAGLMVMAPLISWLLTKYSLGGTILILGGIALNMSMFSSLFLPVKRPLFHLEGVEATSDETFQNVEKSEWDSISGVPLSNETSDIQLMESEDWENGKPEKYIIQIRDEDGHESVMLNGFGGKTTPKAARSPASCQGRNSSSNKPVRLGAEKLCGHLLNPPTWGSEHKLSPHPTKSLPQVTFHHSMDNVASILLARHKANTKHAGDQGNNSIKFQSGNGSDFYLAGSLSTLQITQNKFLQRSHVSSLNTLSPQLLNPPHCNLGHDGIGWDSEHTIEITSCQSLDEKSALNLKENSPQLLSESSQTKPERNTSLSNVFIEKPNALNFTLKDLLVKPVFAVFCCGACLIQIGYPVIGTFLADYAAEHGVSSTQSAYLMSILGGFNIVGRLLGGGLACLGIDPLRLHNGMLFLGSVVCLLCPLYTSFWPLCVFTAMFGFLLGFFPPLQPLIIVEYFGLASLASAFGFLSMMKGLATIAGPPMAGWVYDSCKDYSMSIVFAGSAFLLSSFVHQAMTCFKRR